MRVKVIGMKCFKGVVDGTAIDSGKLFTEVILDQSRNDSATMFSAGQAVEEIKLPNAESVRKMGHLAHLLPPTGPGFYVELETVRVTNGRVARDKVVSAVPVDVPAKLAKAA